MNAPYDQVRKSDEQLLPPMRWLTRAMSSWWTVALLAGAVAAYLLLAYVPMGSRYLWQQRLIDSTQVQVLRWLPLHWIMLLLACAAVWTTLRRMAWHWRSVGTAVASLGLAIALVGLSLSLRFGTSGLVTLKPSTDEGLALTTRYADPIDRVLVVQFGPNAPAQVPLVGLPRWNDTAPLNIPLHNNSALGEQLAFKARVFIAGYIASGSLEINRAGISQARPTPADQRPNTKLPIPPDALLLLRIESEDDAGHPTTTHIWLPFETDGVDRLMPTQRYAVPGVGNIALAFRPAGHDLPFALALTPGDPQTTLHIAEANPTTRSLMPTTTRELIAGSNWVFEPIQAPPGMNRLVLTPLPSQPDGPSYVRLHSSPGRAVLLTGVYTLAGGALLWGLGFIVGTKRRAQP